jgi:hypothetical protein
VGWCGLVGCRPLLPQDLRRDGFFKQEQNNELEQATVLQQKADSAIAMQRPCCNNPTLQRQG